MFRVIIFFVFIFGLLAVILFSPVYLFRWVKKLF